MVTLGYGSAKSLTFRLENIQYGTIKDELENGFYGDDKKNIEVISLAPAVDVPESEKAELTATVCLYPDESSGRAPNWKHRIQFVGYL